MVAKKLLIGEYLEGLHAAGALLVRDVHRTNGCIGELMYYDAAGGHGAFEEGPPFRRCVPGEGTGDVSSCLRVRVATQDVDLMTLPRERSRQVERVLVATRSGELVAVKNGKAHGLRDGL